MATSKGAAKKAVKKGTSSQSISAKGRQQISKAVEAFKNKQKAAGRPISRATLSRVQRELEAGQRKREAKKK